jgi:hypothetical protein
LLTLWIFFMFYKFVSFYLNDNVCIVLFILQFLHLVLLRLYLVCYLYILKLIVIIKHLSLFFFFKMAYPSLNLKALLFSENYILSFFTTMEFAPYWLVGVAKYVFVVKLTSLLFYGILVQNPFP